MPSILVIDDSLSMRHMVSLTLTEAEFEVSLAEDGQEGLEKAKQDQYDLVITDVNMPVMDGLTFVKELRQCESYKYTPILVLTTESSPEKKLIGKEAGATGWIVKPFDPETLIKLVSRVVN